MSDTGLNDEVKEVLGYEGLYIVTFSGQVYALPRKTTDSLGRVTFRRLKRRNLKTTKFGYQAVTLVKDGKSKTHFVHRLMFESFIKKVPEGLQINHIDGNKLNNCLGNLECVTPSENIRHSLDIGLRKPKSGHTFKKTMLNKEQKLEIVKSKLMKKDLAKIYGVNLKTIYNIRRRLAHVVPD